MAKQNFKLTQGSQYILDTLTSACNPLTASEILKSVSHRQNIDRATIYRNLTSLKNKKIIRSLEIGDGVIRYEINLDHHHHLVCFVCKKVQKVDLGSQQEEKLLSSEKEFSRTFGFKQLHHTLEFFGLCSQCQ